MTTRPREDTTPPVPTYPLPPGGNFHLYRYSYVSYPATTSYSWSHSYFLGCFFSEDCWSPLGVQTLPASSFSASSRQTGHPPEAARLHGLDTRSDLQVTYGPFLILSYCELFNWIQTR